MTTFQSIIYSIVHSLTEFFPLSSADHLRFLSQLTGWTAPPPVMLGVFALSGALALLIFFIHDWLSMSSSLIQVILYRKKPMTLDERMPFFLACATLPYLVIRNIGVSDLNFHESGSIYIHVALLIAIGFLLQFAMNFSKKNKSIVDWNWVDALLIGFAQLLHFIPGMGHLAGLLVVSFFRNFSKEAAIKFAFYASLPLMAFQAHRLLDGLDLSQASPDSELSWLSLAVGFVVSFFTSLLTIHAFTKSSQKQTFNSFAIWRLLVGIAVIGSLTYSATLQAP